MTWVKLDDQFPDHPKVVGLSDGALACWVRGLCYSSRHLTDGRIPSAALKGIGSRRFADELCRAELWLQDGDGWIIHDYAEHQRTKADVQAEREAARERARRSREKRSARAPASRRDTAEVTEPEVEVEVDPPQVPRDTGPTSNGRTHEEDEPTGHTDHGVAHWHGNGTPWPRHGEPHAALITATLDHIAAARLQQRLDAGEVIRNRDAWLARTRHNAETEYGHAVIAEVDTIDPTRSDPATIAERIDPTLGPLDGGRARADRDAADSRARIDEMANHEKSPMPDDLRQLGQTLRGAR